MLEWIRANSFDITMVFIVALCIVGWLAFDKNDWGK